MYVFDMKYSYRFMGFEFSLCIHRLMYYTYVIQIINTENKQSKNTLNVFFFPLCHITIT